MTLVRAAHLVLATVVTIACSWGGASYSKASAQDLPTGLETVVTQFAGSHILGTGASHFVAGIRAVDDNNAVATVGEVSDDGRDPNAYTVYVKRLHKKWKVVRYEYVFKPTGKKKSRDQTPPFPYPNWQNDAP